MIKRIFGAANAVVAGSFGVIVLLGYFIPAINPFRFILLQWAVILAGIAVMIGIGNLASVHLQKIRGRHPGWPYSIILLLFLIITVILSVAPMVLSQLTGLLPRAAALQSGADVVQYIMLNGVMLPVEISLMAVLAVTLLYASVRLLRVRSDLTSIIFLVSAVIVLLGIGPMPFFGQLTFVRDWLSPLLATGGARGILIGVALGTLTTGLRILFGADRPYGGD
jgi:hypothetical protein